MAIPKVTPQRLEFDAAQVIPRASGFVRPQLVKAWMRQALAALALPAPVGAVSASAQPTDEAPK
jgi:hypothetical protein